MKIERQPNTQYVLSLSYGKDSLACIEAVMRLGYPLDRIVHAEVWATDTIPADLPPMVEFKSKADEIILQRYGIQVEHICAMQKCSQPVNVERERHTKVCSTVENSQENLSDKSKGSLKQQEVGAKNSKKEQSDTLRKLTYEDLFYKEVHPRKATLSRGGVQAAIRLPDKDRELVQRASQSKSSRQVLAGFQRYGNGSPCSRLLKSEVFRRSREIGARHTSNKTFSSGAFEQGAKINTVQYLGIAADEPERIERHQKKKGIVLPLVDIGWDEAYCRRWCEENDLLSPIYTTATRGGCWFCHNQGVEQLRLLRKNYPELWKLLLKWDGDSPVTFHSDGHTVHDFDKRFRLEDEGFIDPAEKFRWSFTENPFKQISIFENEGETK